MWIKWRENPTHEFLTDRTYGVCRFMRKEDEALSDMDTGCDADDMEDRVLAASEAEFAELCEEQSYG